MSTDFLGNIGGLNFVTAGEAFKLAADAQRNGTFGKSTIQKIAMGAKPDPYKFTIVHREIVNNNTIIMANYEGCKTFKGNKLMLLKGTPKISETLDPHFLDEEYAVIGRFIPNELGWKMARLCAQSI